MHTLWIIPIVPITNTCVYPYYLQFRHLLSTYVQFCPTNENCFCFLQNNWNSGFFYSFIENYSPWPTLAIVKSAIRSWSIFICHLAIFFTSFTPNFITLPSFLTEDIALSRIFSKFSCSFLSPNNFFQFEL